MSESNLGSELAKVCSSLDEIGLRYRMSSPSVVVARFGPSPHRPALDFYFEIDVLADVLSVQARPGVAFPADARPELCAVINKWHSSHRWPRLRLDGDDVEGLVYVADLHFPGLSVLTAEHLEPLIGVAVEGTLMFWRTISMRTDPVGPMLAGLAAMLDGENNLPDD